MPPTISPPLTTTHTGTYQRCQTCRAVVDVEGERLPHHTGCKADPERVLVARQYGGNLFFAKRGEEPYHMVRLQNQFGDSPVVSVCRKEVFFYSIGTQGGLPVRLVCPDCVRLADDYDHRRRLGMDLSDL